jgi:hypothetical protein
MSDHPHHVKYPFQGDDGRWAVRYHIPYAVEHEGQAYGVVASIYAQPEVHGSILVSRAGETVAQYDDLTPGDVVEITGDAWRVAAVDYRTRIVLERAEAADKGEEPADA